MSAAESGAAGLGDSPGPSEFSGCDVALFVAVDEEAAEMRRRIRAHLVGGDGRLHGDWRGRHVRLQVSGPGPRQAERAARRMLQAVRPRLVICAGLAGGLHPAFRRGDLAVAEHVVGPPGEPSFACDRQAVEAASLQGARRGVLLTSPRVACTVEEKHALSSRAALVDMESWAVANVAAEHGVPFVAVRVVSDAADEGFPIDMNLFLDGEGNVRRAALAVAALRRPGGLRFLLGLRATTVRASYTLATSLERMLDAIRLVSCESQNCLDVPPALARPDNAETSNNVEASP